MCLDERPVAWLESDIDAWADSRPIAPPCGTPGPRPGSGRSPVAAREPGYSANRFTRWYTQLVGRRFVLALVVLAALWQGVAWAHFNVAAMTHSPPANSAACLGMPSLDGHPCNDCCGSGAPSCQMGCDLLGTTAVSLDANLHLSSGFQPALLTVLRDARFVSRDAAPPHRPPIL